MLPTLNPRSPVPPHNPKGVCSHGSKSGWISPHVPTLNPRSPVPPHNPKGVF